MSSPTAREVCDTTTTIDIENNFVILNEKYDIQKCYNFLISGVADDSYYNSIMNYIKNSTRFSKVKSQENIYSNRVAYVYPNNNIGRFKTYIAKKVKKEDKKEYYDIPVRCSTQTSMWNELKAYILPELYYDIDMVNCHPVILEQTMKKHNLKTKYVNKYNTNRERYLEKIMKKLDITKKEAKGIVIKFMYGKSTKCELYKCLPKSIRKYVKEVKKAIGFLIETYPQYLNESKRLKELKKEEYNYEGSASALYLQTEERKILECMYEFFTHEGFEIGALVYDGLHLEKSKLVTKEVLEKCSKYIKKKLDYDIQLAIKDFQKIELDKLPILKKFDPLNLDDDNKYSKNNIHHINCDKICPIGGNPFENIDIFDSDGKLKKIILLKAKTGDGKTHFAKQAHNYFKNNKEILKKYITDELKNVLSNEKKERNREINGKLNKGLRYEEVDEDEDDSDDEEEDGCDEIDNGYVSDDEDMEEKSSYNIKFLSIVPRVSLSYSHEIEFGLKNYQDTKEHGLDEVYQLDSIDKFVNPNNDYYIVFLDEVASLCSHFNNRMAKMSKNRLDMINIFKDIINSPKCICVLGADDNLNDGTIDYIRTLTKKPIDIYVNDKVKKYDQPVNIHNNICHIVKQMKQDIKNGTKIFCCSNKNAKFFRQVVRPIIDELKLKEGEYLIYSGDMGEKMAKDYIDKHIQKEDGNEEEEPEPEFKGKIITADWNKVKIIFTTPSIIYGVSYDEIKTHKVYGYYFRNSVLNAMDCNQQLNRIRSPISFDIYIEKQRSRSFKNLESCEKHIYDNVMENYSGEKKSVKNAMIAINGLFIFDNYIKSYYDDLFYYVPYLLRKKGYVNINVKFVSDCEKQLSYTEKEYNKIMKEDYKEGIIDVKKMTQVSIYLASYGFNKLFVAQNPVLNKIEEEMTEKVIDIFLNPEYYRCLELYRNVHYRIFEKNLEKYNDTQLLKVYSDDYKLKLMDDLHKILGIEWFDTELLAKLKQQGATLLRKIDGKDKELDNLYKRISHKSRFRTESKKPENYIEWVKLLLKCYKMFCKDIAKSKQRNLSFMNGKKQEQETISEIQPIINKFKSIIEYDKDILKLKEEYKKNHATIIDYLFE